MTDSLELIYADAAMRGALVVLLLLTVSALLRDRAHLQAARVGMAMALGLCVQVIGSSPPFEAQPRLWQAPLVAIAVGNAVLFWVFVQALTDDDFELRPLHVFAWIFVALLGGLNCALLGGSGYAIAPYTVGLQRITPLIFAVLASIAALMHWKSDLVEGRRWLRGFIVVYGVAYSVSMGILRLSTPQGRLDRTSAPLDMALLLVVVAVVAVRMLRLRESELFPSERVKTAAAHAPRFESSIDSVVQVADAIAGDLIGNITGERTGTTTDEAANPATRLPSFDELHSVERASTPTPDPAEQRLAETLQRAMCDERAYRTEDLTVASLAARLNVPEYKLRRVINQRLGHRNFNAYVNGFRLEDARAALADPAKRDLPILTIALDAGFQSIGPFNRAFKTATGVTPGDFRREKLADS